jgi:predicted KAP-like P-loop ATPase
MWNDCETEIDLIGYKNLARAVISLIQERDLSPLTIGIHGDWGAGKTSMLKFICTELESDKKVLCLTFNGWLFEGYDDAKSALMETIITELVNAQPANRKLREQAIKLLKRVNWLRFARKTAGVAFTLATGIPDVSLIEGLISQTGKIIADPSNASAIAKGKDLISAFQSSMKEQDKRTIPTEIHAFRKEFGKLLDTAKIERLVVIVDDLDRCLPSTAIDTLEAIRLFLFVPKTTFILAADENMIAYAVSKHFPELPITIGQADYSKNYLEKLVQVPIRIPPLNKRETQIYIALLFIEHALKENKILRDKIIAISNKIISTPSCETTLRDSINTELGSIPEAIKDSLLLSEKIGSVLAEGLKGNPRQIKRFLNTIMLRVRIAGVYGIQAQINLHVLAKLMLLERFNEQIYKDLVAQLGQSIDGRIEKLKGFEQGIKAEEGEGIPQEWNKEAVITWGKIDPPLGEIDLRPYIYISREKDIGFVGLREDLEQTFKRLSDATELTLPRMEADLKLLAREDAKKIFSALVYKINSSSDLRIKPREFDGLCFLCKNQADLQDSLATWLSGLPVSAIGNWVLVGIKAILSKDTAIEAYNSLCDKWRTQTDNLSLKRAADQLKRI